MIPLQSYVRQGRHTLRRWLLDPRFHGLLRSAGYLLAGFFLSAASLASHGLPFSMGLVFACNGWPATLVAVGGGLGYFAFWGSAGYQGILWVAAALITVLLVADRRVCRDTPLLLPATAGLLVAASGLAFQLLMGDTTSVPMYLLRVALGFGSAWLFSAVMQGKNPILEWLCGGVAVLALAQIAPIPYFGLGFIAAGVFGVSSAFPAAATAGLALDLAQVTPVPMTAVMTCSFFVRLLPRCPKWILRIAPTTVYLITMVLVGRFDLHPLPGLLMGGVLGSLLPIGQKVAPRRGETGGAQVKLELAAGVLAQAEQLLLETPELPVDEDALVYRGAERACSTCSYRKGCKDAKRLGKLPGLLLHKPLLSAEELPIVCRKSGRFLAELHRSQEQLRSIRADRERQQEYRSAVLQQYRFLSEFLQDLSDRLAHRIPSQNPYYTPEVRMFGNRPQEDNGDRCISFAGTQCNYYILMCDGMGTGMGAVQEGKTAAGILKKLLCAGFPAEYALRSLNSLCALRDRAGIVTIDLGEINLETGKGTLYKWGAMPSYVVSHLGAEKIGTAGPPPGLSVTEFRESSHRLSLRRGETLVFVSVGVGEEEALHCCLANVGRSPERLATDLLSCGHSGGEDDATVITVRLLPSAPGT